MFVLKIFAIILIFSIFLNVACAESNDFKELRSDHFIIHSYKDVDESYVFKIKDMAEDFYKTITQEFKLVRDKLWLWDNRASIFIAKDKDDYVKKFKCPDWSGACVNYRDKMIYTYPYQESFSSILTHELTHIIFREYVGQNRLPLWLDEGVAVYVDDKYAGATHQTAIASLSKAIKDKSYIKFSELAQIDFLTLQGKPQDYVSLFYLEAFSIVNFLIKKGSGDNFYNFLYFLKGGNSIDGALSKAFYSIKNMNDLEAQWIKFYQE